MDQLANAVVDGVGEVVVQVIGLHGQPRVHLLVDLLDQRVDIHVVPGGNGHHRHAQAGEQAGAVDHVPLFLHLVHEVHRQRHGTLQLQKLHGQVQVPLQVGGVHDVDDGVGLLLDDELPGHQFLHGVGRQGVDARQVHHREFQLPQLGPAFLFLHRHAGPVAHVLVGARQGVEQCGFAAVGVAHQGHLPGPLVVGPGVVGAGVELLLMPVGPVHGLQVFRVGAAHGAAGAVPVAGRPQVVGALRHRFPLPGLHRLHADPDLGRILLPQAQLVAPQPHLHRVPEGGRLDELHRGTRRQPHIDEAAFHRPPLVAHLLDHAAAAYGQLV